MASESDKRSESGDSEPSQAASPSAKPLKGRGRAVEFARRLARPISERTERRRQKIFEDAIAAAQTIAREEGLEGLTARRVARSIGCSVGTLYNVFDNLDTLILHLNGKTVEALYDEFLALELPADAEQAVRLAIKTYLDFVRDNANLWSVIFDHVWPKDYPIPEWYLEKIRRPLAFVAKAMMPMFPPEKREECFQAATVLWSGLHGVYSLANAGKLGIVTSETVSALTDEMIANILAGLKSRYSVA